MFLKLNSMHDERVFQVQSLGINYIETRSFTEADPNTGATIAITGSCIYFRDDSYLYVKQSPDEIIALTRKDHR
jgi:hypothetical protein